MIKKIVLSFALAIHNIRSHFFHTLLSILGIVIGVASLVAILSLIDGMEQFARDQITQTTSLNAISANSNPYERINGVRIKKDTFGIITYNNFKQINLSKPASIHLYSSSSREVKVDTTRVGALLYYTAAMNHPKIVLAEGRLLEETDLANRKQVAVINKAFVDVLLKSGAEPLNKSLTIEGREFIICGTLKDNNDKSPTAYMPLSVLIADELKNYPPGLVVEAENVEDVPLLKSEIESFLTTTFPNGKEDFIISTNEARVKQAAQGFLLFRVIMGLIVGISVLVGGIGVMNVLLISVTERTAEIGVRKAMGAKRGDIVLLFLSESVTISSLGSIAGLVLGVLGTMVFIPIIRAITEAPFQAAFTWATILVVSIIAIVVGVAFGTYPALRASRLDPVEAIRHE